MMFVYGMVPCWDVDDDWCLVFYLRDLMTRKWHEGASEMLDMFYFLDLNGNHTHVLTLNIY